LSSIGSRTCHDGNAADLSSAGAALAASVDMRDQHSQLCCSLCFDLCSAMPCDADRA
jgi:hypothetical protein